MRRSVEFGRSSRESAGLPGHPLSGLAELEHQIRLRIPELSNICCLHIDNLKKAGGFTTRLVVRGKVSITGGDRLKIKIDGDAQITENIFEGTGIVELTYKRNFVQFVGSWTGGNIRANTVITNFGSYSAGMIAFDNISRVINLENLRDLRRGWPIGDFGLEIGYEKFTMIVPLDPRKEPSIRTSSGEEFTIDFLGVSDDENYFTLPSSTIKVVRLYQDFLQFSCGQKNPFRGHFWFDNFHYGVH